MISHVPFYFLRHGETDWNLNRRAQGQIDIPLNATGIAQAKAAAEVVRGLGIRSICASPLIRAYETARFATEASGVPVTVIEELKECGLGADEGRAGGSWFMDWRAGTYCPDDAERYEDFLARALRGINKSPFWLLEQRDRCLVKHDLNCWVRCVLPNDVVFPGL